jgi:inositol-polyphosphate multikinase
MQIQLDDPEVLVRILEGAIRRASKWMSLNEKESAQPMIGQVGGLSKHKKPIKTMAPDYVLKPLSIDHRGIREVAFYEVVKMLSQNPTVNVYTAFLTAGRHTGGGNHVSIIDPNGSGTESGSSAVSTLPTSTSRSNRAYARIRKFWQQSSDTIDTVAVAMAMLLNDPVVAESEVALETAWKNIRREIEALRHLAKFTPPYHGVVGQDRILISPERPFGVADDAHLLLQDITINYSKPCVMDLKMGTTTFEPDAPDDKKHREQSKYLHQRQHGFRIIGMRIYNPSHPDADLDGFRYFDKTFGRSLMSRDDVLDAFTTFFGAGASGQESSTLGEKPANALEVNGSSTVSSPTASTRIRNRAAANVLAELRPIRRWFEDNKSLRFYASSLLIAYEGDVSIDSSSRDAATVKMIDFGRVRRSRASSTSNDRGYCHGLSVLKDVILDIIRDDDEIQQQLSGHGASPSDSRSSSILPPSLSRAFTTS